jgi:hypothetical protein
LIWVALAADSPLTFWASGCGLYAAVCFTLLEQVDAENACCSSVTVPDGNMAAQHQRLDVEASSLQDGMSFNDWVSVTLVL